MSRPGCSRFEGSCMSYLSIVSLLVQKAKARALLSIASIGKGPEFLTINVREGPEFSYRLRPSKRRKKFMVCCTQLRRVAATSFPSRVALSLTQKSKNLLMKVRMTKQLYALDLSLAEAISVNTWDLLLSQPDCGVQSEVVQLMLLWIE
ncbi:hypothetical protein M8C21_032388 [Ambrosia artemisiifolia]|uniref:Uncharacterized protein n=1 Tax=Ambrosia artemisiifolia TaxID=4212 RepID=A0AAD5DAI5_AMBAR|nr:hypothetical protein M8C21_032388 [Ambrosia artemisiifolia]